MAALLVVAGGLGVARPGSGPDTATTKGRVRQASPRTATNTGEKTTVSPKAVLPFTLKRSSDVMGLSTITSTTETVHGLLTLDEQTLVVQWRLARRTELVGHEIRSDQEVEPVREVVVPLEGVAGAIVRRPGWAWWRGPRLVLTATDLRAFEDVAGAAGLGLDHPAELVLQVRRGDRLAAEEFSAELALQVARRALERDEDRPRLTPHTTSEEGG